MLINVIVMYCGAVLVLSTAITFLLWLGYRHRLIKNLLFFWLSGILCYISQGIFSKLDIYGFLAFSVNWMTIYYTLKIFSESMKIKLPYLIYNSILSVALVITSVLILEDFTYQISAAVFCLACAGVLIHASTLKLKSKKDNLISYGYRIIMIFAALHFLDYPILRPVQEYAIIGFSISFVFFFCFAVYVPIFIIKKISHEYNKDLITEVETRTAQLKELNNQLTIAFENLRLKNLEIDTILKDYQSRLSVLVHDLSTPLTLLIYNVNNLITNPTAYFNQINVKGEKLRSATKTMEHILKEARHVHAAKLGKKNISLQEVSLDAVIREVLDLYETRLSQKNVTVEYDANELKKYKVLANDAWLKDHILSNLISNAIKFSYAGGTIKINALSADQKLVNLYVQDSGVGIPSDKKNKIFDLNIATSSNGTSGETGTGLGLPIVKQYTELMGGKIRVFENNQTSGTCFELTLSKAA